MSHPSPSQLDAFSRGDLSDSEADAIELHLIACGACQQQLSHVSSDDPLIELLRSVAHTADASLPESWRLERAAPVQPPRAPDGYDLLEPIGRGGMGIVYRAWQRTLRRPVAFKVIRSMLDASPRELARFQTESLALAQVRHPHIVQIYDAGVQDGLPYLAMEYVEGGSLADRLRSGPLPPRQAARLVERVSLAVHEIHRHGITHRDLKPANILLAADGQPKLSDFGLARWIDPDSPAASTHTGATLGTPAYMSPEQALGQPAGPPSDLYGLGVVLYECLTGRPPFQAATPLETLDLVRDSEPPIPSRIQPGIPPDLQSICLMCLEKDPKKRYPTALEIAEDLARFQRGEPVRARTVGAAGRLIKWARRRPAPAALVALLTASTVAGALGLLGHQARLRVEIDRANQAAADARAQRAGSLAQYRAARAAIQQILARFENPKYLDLSHGIELRSEQTEAALAFYKQLGSATIDPDPELQLDQAVALREAANLQIVLGHATDAEQNLSAAVHLLESLAPQLPEDSNVMRQLMSTHQKWGVLLQGREPARSLEHLNRSLALAEQLAAQHGSSDQNRLDLSWCEHNLGSTFLYAPALGDPRPHLERAAHLLRPLVEADPNRLDLKVSLAGTLVNLGLALTSSHPAEADTHFAEAAALLEAAAAAQPDDVRRRHVLSSLLVNWGNLAAAQGQHDRALDLYQKGLTQIESLLTQHPAVPDFAQNALNLRGARATLLDRLQRHGEAAADWEHVVALARRTNSPESFLYRCTLLISSTRAGAIDRALAELPALQAQIRPGVAEDYYKAACAYAVAADFAARDLPPGQPELPDHLAAEALNLLRHCQLLGNFNLEPNRRNALNDPDLKALRDTPEFTQIVQPRTAPGKK